MTKRSPKWPIFFGIVTSLAVGFTTSAALLLHKDGLFDAREVWFLYSASASAAFAAIALWSWYAYERSRRAYAKEMRQRRVAKVVADQEAFDRARANELVANSRLQVAEEKLAAKTAEEQRLSRQAKDPTVTLRPGFGRAESPFEMRRRLLGSVPHQTVNSSLEEAFKRNWQSETGEIRMWIQQRPSFEG